MENPTQLIRSWVLQGAHAGGNARYNKLVPQDWERIQTNFVQTWREDNVSSSLDWGVHNLTYYMPDLSVINGLFLEINLPVLGGGTYKPFPGLYAIASMRFLTEGKEAYVVEPALFLRDYLESLETDEVKQFADIFLGGTTATAHARKIMVPIFLPNSPYFHRDGRESKGHGVWPCYTGTTRLEIQFTMAEAATMVRDSSQAVPASIKDECKVMIHVVNLEENDRQIYRDQRGRYSVYNRRFQELTDGWTRVDAATTLKLTEERPLGTITELVCLAIDESTGEIDDAEVELEAHVLPDLFEIRADSELIKSLDTDQKNRIELWTNGYDGNTYFSMVGRLCFAVHAAESDSQNIYTGGYNMKLASNVDIRVKFPKAVKCKVFAVQIERHGITKNGNLTASLD
jgi:hypothetical protein